MLLVSSPHPLTHLLRSLHTPVPSCLSSSAAFCNQINHGSSGIYYKPTIAIEVEAVNLDTPSCV